jgi:hypothetical protein
VTDASHPMTVVPGSQIGPGALLSSDLIPVRRVVRQHEGDCPDGSTAAPGRCACNRGALPPNRMPHRVVGVEGYHRAEVTIYDHVLHNIGGVTW